jgi:hypothetical protein
LRRRKRREYPKVLRNHFGKFVDGTDFEFLRNVCRPVLDRYVSLHDVSVDAIIADAKSFFRGKEGIVYDPGMARLTIERRNGMAVARLPVQMSWRRYPPPRAWPTPDDEPWPHYPDAPHVDHSVTVDAEVTFDDQCRMMSYVETKIHAPNMRITGEHACEYGVYATPRDPLAASPDVSRIATLKKGAVVRDLGDTFIVSVTPKGPETARRIRVDGRDGWTDDSRAYAVPNPYGGTPAGGSVPEARRRWLSVGSRAAPAPWGQHARRCHAHRPRTRSRRRQLEEARRARRSFSDELKAGAVGSCSRRARRSR